MGLPKREKLGNFFKNEKKQGGQMRWEKKREGNDGMLIFVFVVWYLFCKRP